MFPVAGIETLAGGRNSSHPYSGADGEKRWAKMKENVVKEWEAEQKKKKEAEHERSSVVGEGGAVDAGDGEVGGVNGGAEEGRLERIKAKLFKH